MIIPERMYIVGDKLENFSRHRGVITLSHFKNAVRNKSILNDQKKLHIRFDH